MFRDWYNNASELPSGDMEEVKAAYDKLLTSLESAAKTPHLLGMNGCDHQPVQANLSKALETARKLYPDVEFIHGSFPEYVEALKKDIPENLSTIKGELINQDTNGWDTLLNTASSRIYLKQMNRKGESALDRIAEPLCLMASLSGREYPHDLLAYSWKTLM
jgi:alpha-mannosidase